MTQTNPSTVFAGLRLEARGALRRLLRRPGFAAVATLTFALGIAGTTVFFAVLDQVYLRPLPFPQADRLVRLRVAIPTADGGGYLANVLPAEEVMLAARARTLETVVAQRVESRSLLGHGDPVALGGASLSPGTLALFGWQPIAGRLFTPAEEGAGEDSAVVLIGARLWREKFNADPAVIGRTVRLDDRVFTVIGVLPQAFPYRADFWLPLRVDAADRRDLLVLGRLAPGASLAAARAEITALAKEYERTSGLHAGLDATLLRDNLVRDEQRVALGLFLAAVLFLTLSAVNLAGLLAVRAVARRRELAVRAAIGAGRARQIGGLLVEPLLVALAGGVMALVAVRAATPFLGALLPHVLSEELGFRLPGLDLRIVAVAFAASALAALGAGLVPALAFGRTSPRGALGSGRSADRSGHERGTGFLLALQVALVFSILLGGGALIEGFLRAKGRGVGFDTRGMLALEVQPSPGRYPDDGARRRLVERLTAEIGAVPQTTAAVTTVNPLGGGSWGFGVGRAGTTAANLTTVNLRLVSPGFLDALRIPLLRGRDLGTGDREGTAPVAVVSRRLAERLWGSEDAVGQILAGRSRAGGEVALTVVGVAADVADAYDLHETVYLPFAQNASHPAAADSLWLLARGDLGRDDWRRAVERAVWRVDDTLAWREAKTMDGMRDEALAQSRLGSTLAAAFVCGALLLTALGLGGAVAFAVRERQAEIGVRLALGATAAGVVALFARRSALRALVGVLLGGAAYAVLRPLVAHFIAGVGAAGGWTIASALALVLGVGALASYLPARRAARVDPVIALRSE